ncbi:MAG: hypothetical protein ACI80K_000945 [Paracoccaceae bacterium]|jgi:hypothetical protein
MLLFSQSPACRWRDRPGPRALVLLGFVVPLLLSGCSDAESGSSGSLSPAVAEAPGKSARVELPEIERLFRGPVRVEALEETLDVWLATVANKVRIRDFDGIQTAFTSEFEGELLFPKELPFEASEALPPSDLPLGVRLIALGPPDESVGVDSFMQELERNLSGWARVSQSSWRLDEARFENPGHGKTVEWGIGEVRIHIVGNLDGSGTIALNATASALVENHSGQWRISRFRIKERELMFHDTPIFSEVSRAAGVAFDGLRFGEPGNDNVGWNGIAAADVDGDGLIDVFLPGARSAFLYRANGEGSFTEEADARGLGGADSGTGAVFFDYDRDGDQDLAVAYIGWRKLDDSLAGRPITLYKNDGTGNFSDVTEAVGLSRLRLPAYSLTAFDADGDGWTDLFACGYGRMEEEDNNSWIEASNGASDLMLRNVDGKSFRDVTEESGLSDRRWSYASAAADYDEDGDLDLYVGNNFGTSRLWRNRGDGTFEDVAKELGVDVRGNVMGVLWTDLDGDGRLDLYLSSPTSTSGQRILSSVGRERGELASRGMLQMANGNKVFLGRLVDSGQAEGVLEPGAEGGPRKIKQMATFVRGDMGGKSAGWSWSAASPDIDLDGHRDIVCVNGFVTGQITGDT